METTLVYWDLHKDSHRLEAIRGNFDAQKVPQHAVQSPQSSTSPERRVTSIESYNHRMNQKKPQYLADYIGIV